jgi:PAS domain S-box-containing protein
MPYSWKNRMASLRIVAIYAFIGSLWILFSDTLLGHFTHDPDLLERFSVLKGLGFVFFTAFLLYHLIHLHIGRTSAANHRLASSLEHLQAANEKLKLTDFSVNNISDAIQWITMDTRLWDVNQAACDMLGYTREELLSLSLADIDPHFNLERWQAHLQAIKESGSIRHKRFHRTKDGRVFPVEITSNYFIFNDIEYYCATVRDITEQTRAEKEAAFSRSLIELTRDPFYVLSPEEGFRMVYANRASCEHFGMDLETLQTLSIPDWDPAFDMSQVDALLERQRRGESQRFETLHRVASGKLVPVEVTANQLMHDGREYICGYFYDITERKAMDSALKESEARYRTLSQEFQALLDGVPDALTLLSPDLKVLWANHASAWHLSLKPEEMIEAHCYKLRHGTDSPCEKCVVQETFTNGRPGKTTFIPPATALTFELRSVPVKDEEGKVIKVIEIARDITEQVKAEADHIELERKLLHTQKLESLGILAGGIAHDFNNILTGILGNLSILRRLMPEGHEALERIGRCEKAVSRATGLTCQLLTFAKGGDPIKKPTDLRPVIENAVTFALTGSNAASEVHISAGLWPVQADEGQIGQVLNNLLINAAQAMPLGGVVRVEATNLVLGQADSASLTEGQYVRISVADQGLGITRENLRKIFDPYFTTKETGTGLGLTSVYAIVRKHGGDIVVLSEVGKGTRFEVILPASLEEAAQEESPATPSLLSGRGAVVVMDDEDLILDMVREMLSLLGYESEGCRRGEDLIRTYRRMVQEGHPPDAVIIDLTIRGGMGGLDAARAILRFDPAARLIVASGYSTDPVVANYRDYGFVAALAKPYRMEDISTELARILKN